MNRTVLAVIVLAVIIAIAGFLFYDGSTGDETIIDKAAEQAPASEMAPATEPAPAPAPAP